jgi:hypothetical protein
MNMIFTDEALTNLNRLDYEREKAEKNLYNGIVAELAKIVDNKHAIKIHDDRNETFYNVCTDENERIEYVTTDGEDIFLMSGEQNVFFNLYDYGWFSNWCDFQIILTDEENVIEEIDWTNMH